MCLGTKMTLSGPSSRLKVVTSMPRGVLTFHKGMLAGTVACNYGGTRTVAGTASGRRITLTLTPPGTAAEAGADRLVAAAGRANLLLIGLSERWRKEGLGATRQAIARTAPASILFVRRGERPGALAPATVREGLKVLFEAEPDLVVVGEASDPAETCAARSGVCFELP